MFACIDAVWALVSSSQNPAVIPTQNTGLWRLLRGEWTPSQPGPVQSVSSCLQCSFSVEQVLHVQVEREPHNVWHLGPVWEWWMPFCAMSKCHEDSTQRSWCISIWERQWFHQLLFWFPPPGGCWSVIWYAAHPGEEIPVPVAVLQWRNLQFQAGKCYIHDKAIFNFFYFYFKTSGYSEHL